MSLHEGKHMITTTSASGDQRTYDTEAIFPESVYSSWQHFQGNTSGPPRYTRSELPILEREGILSFAVQDDTEAIFPESLYSSWQHFPGNTSGLPRYTRSELPILEREGILSFAVQDDDRSLPITEYPPLQTPYWSGTRDKIDVGRQIVIDRFFQAIKLSNDELVAAFIESGLVTTETTNRDGLTPLLSAIESGHMHTAQQLINFNANINAYGNTIGTCSAEYGQKPDDKYRTPLQCAAENGHLAMVKLLIETYGADDTMIAPDGQLALRLAASNGHREIVDYLPSRRGGGFRRWKTKHRTAMRRVKEVVKKIAGFFKALFFEAPKLFLYTLPKKLIIQPILKRVKWMAEHRAEIPAILAARFKALPKRVLERLGKAMRSFIEFLWKRVRNSPKAMKIALLWIWDGLRTISGSILNASARFFAFLHTAVAAIVTFLGNVTLKDIWNGLVSFIRAVIIDGPKKTWEWLGRLGKLTYEMFETLLGCFGRLICALAYIMFWIVSYVPVKIWNILKIFGTSLRAGGREFLIWCDPKRS